MTAQDHDLDDIAARLPELSMAELFRQIDEARQAAENAPPPEPTIIPMPELSPMWSHPDSGKVRYPCTAAGGCSWRYEVDTALESIQPLVMPVGVSTAALDQFLTKRAEKQLRDLRDRIEEGIRDHFRTAHQGQEPPLQGVAMQARGVGQVV